MVNPAQIKRPGEIGFGRGVTRTRPQRSRVAAEYTPDDYGLRADHGWPAVLDESCRGASSQDSRSSLSFSCSSLVKPPHTPSGSRQAC